jgi:hypothetical protein
MQRQAWLYEPGRRFHALVWEAALHALVCPPVVLAAQLDRLMGTVGLDTVELGVVPLGAALKIPTANRRNAPPADRSQDTGPVSGWGQVSRIPRTSPL